MQVNAIVEEPRTHCSLLLGKSQKHSVQSEISFCLSHLSLGPRNKREQERSVLKMWSAQWWNHPLRGCDSVDEGKAINTLINMTQYKQTQRRGLRLFGTSRYACEDTAMDLRDLTNSPQESQGQKILPACLSYRMPDPFTPRSPMVQSRLSSFITFTFSWEGDRFYSSQILGNWREQVHPHLPSSPPSHNRMALIPQAPKQNSNISGAAGHPREAVLIRENSTHNSSFCLLSTDCAPG